MSRFQLGEFVRFPGDVPRQVTGIRIINDTAEEFYLTDSGSNWIQGEQLSSCGPVTEEGAQAPQPI